MLDCQKLNQFVQVEHFKMERIPALRDLIEKDDFICKIDLKDAYVVVPIHEDSKDYLSFENRGTVYRYQLLAFGLSISPRIFSKLMRYAIEPLRKEGIRLTYYLDNICLLAKTKEEMNYIHNYQSKNTSRGPRIHYKLQKEYFNTITNTRVSRVQFQHQEDDNLSTTIEDHQITSKVKTSNQVTKKIMYNRKPINPNSYIHHPSGDSSKSQLWEPFTKEQVSLSNNAFQIEGLVTVGKLVDALKSYASRTCT
jgi:hypothetical protein